MLYPSSFNKRTTSRSSDVSKTLVTEIEFINAKAGIEVADDVVKLQAAAGSPGFIGVILRQTFMLNKLLIAMMHPEDVPTPLAIPTPSRDWVPQQNYTEISKYADAELADARQKMVKEFRKLFYVNYYWFTFQPYPEAI